MKISMNPVVKYLRELSVVVIGIAITVSIGLWINDINNHKDLKLYLNAIKLEMEENMVIISFRLEHLQKSIGYVNYLRSHDKESLNADTIRSYGGGGGYYSIGMFYYKATAFEMFKNSGFMRFMDDKQLLIDIWNVYSGLEELKDDVEIINQMKLEEIKQDKLKSKDKDFIPMYDFHIETSMFHDLQEVYERQLKNIKETAESF